MPSPRRLRVGDRVRFVSLPEEWNAPGYTIHKSSVEFMKRMIRRGRSCRIAFIEGGGPWIVARLRCKDGRREYHQWRIIEKTGWRLVEKRRRRFTASGRSHAN
jgi:hypothetical protein